MGMVDGEFIVNPSQKQWDKGDLQLTVASTAEKVIMIEAGANEIPEDKMIEAIYKCHDVNQTIIAFINKIVAEVGKPKHEYTSCAIPEEMFAAIKETGSSGRDGGGCIHRREADSVRRISARLRRSWQRLSQTMRSGLLFWARQFTSIRRRLSAR